MRPAKVQYLEGLRGIAAMQVVLLHFVTGFLPDTAEHAWPPLRVLFDGHTAVYVFFLISGTVLTPSFARPGAFVGKMAKRVVRLGIPVAAAAAIATALLAGCFPMRIGRPPPSPDRRGWRWTPAVRRRSRTLRARSASTACCSAIARRRCSRRWPGNCRRWSCRSTRRSGRCIWNFTVRCWCCAWFRCAPIRSGRTALRWSRPRCRSAPIRCSCSSGPPGVPSAANRREGRATGFPACSCCCSGVALCATKDWHVVEWLRLMLSRTELAYAPNLFQFQSQLGAVALYLGVLWCPLVWPLLESAAPPPSWAACRSASTCCTSRSCSPWCASPSPSMPAGSTVAAFVLFLALTLLAAIAFERLVDRPAIALSRRIGIVPLVSPREMTQK